MSRLVQPTVMMTRTSVLQDPYPQGPHNECARGGATRGRCESVQRRQGLPRTKTKETPLVPRTGQSNSAELVEKCPPTTKHKVRNAVTTAEVKSPKLQTCDEHQPRGDWSHEPRDLDGRSGSEGVQTQWKPLETRPHHVSGARGDSGADASHWTVQAWMDSREKTSKEGTPVPKNEKNNHCGKEWTNSW